MNSTDHRRTIDVCTEIEQERFRQIKQEGFDTAHDDRHDDFQMTEAAICYAMKVGMIDQLKKAAPKRWPWDAEWWKPGADRRMLIKAAALLVAEIERLDRASEKEQGDAA